VSAPNRKAMDGLDEERQRGVSAASRAASRVARELSLRLRWVLRCWRMELGFALRRELRAHDSIVILVSALYTSQTPLNASFHFIRFIASQLSSTQSKTPPKPPFKIRTRTTPFPLPRPLTIAAKQQRIEFLFSTPRHSLHSHPTPLPSTSTQPLISPHPPFNLRLEHILKNPLSTHKRLKWLRSPTRTRRILTRPP